MANLVNIYNKGNTKRILKHIESEVAKACSGYLYQPMTPQMLQQMRDDTRQSIVTARMRYGVDPFEPLLAVMSISDGTRTAFVKF